jgi:hypothetical protein
MVVLVAGARLEALMGALVVLETRQAQVQVKEIMVELGLVQQVMELEEVEAHLRLAQMPRVILVVMAVRVQHLL